MSTDRANHQNELCWLCVFKQQAVIHPACKSFIGEEMKKEMVAEHQSVLSENISIIFILCSFSPSLFAFAPLPFFLLNYLSGCACFYRFFKYAFNICAYICSTLLLWKF